MEGRAGAPQGRMFAVILLVLLTNNDLSVRAWGWVR